MGVPYNGSPMAQHPQYITVRNSRGRDMLDALGSELVRTPPVDTGDRRPLVVQVRVLLVCVWSPTHPWKLGAVPWGKGVLSGMARGD